LREILLPKNKLLRIQKRPSNVFRSFAAITLGAAAEEGGAAGGFGFGGSACDDGPEEGVDDFGVVFFGGEELA